MSDRETVDVCVVGGGPAGMTAALYTTRLGQDTVVFEKPGGRHAAVSNVHNLYGVSEDVSGQELSAHAVDQFEEYGGSHRLAAVEGVDEETGGDRRFSVQTGDGAVVARRVVFATGFTDRGPDVPGLEEFTGRGLHYCLHCDAFALGGRPVYVLGHDDDAAEVAMLMLNFTADVDLLLDGRDPAWDAATTRQLRAHPVDLVDTEVVGAFPTDDDGENSETGDGGDPWLGGLRFADGTERSYRGGFAMYGSEYATDLAADLGCAVDSDGALTVDERQETSVDGVYGVGDVTHGQNQTTIAMADGAKAGIAIHKDLREFPRSVDGEASVDAADVPDTSPALLERMHRIRTQDTHAGLREPSPRE